MNQVYACVDGRTNTPAVIDAAIWAARRLDQPLALLHALTRDPQAPADYSGAIGLDAQAALLTALSDLDRQRALLAQDAGRAILAAACARATAAGLDTPDTHLRHGALTDSAIEPEPQARLFILGEHFHGTPGRRLHLDHQVERLIRSVQRPVLVIPDEHWVAPEQVVLAYDGSATASAAIERVAASPLLQGLPVHLVMAHHDANAALGLLAPAQRTLLAAGFDVTTQALPGEPEDALPAFTAQQPRCLLVIGAYGHSRIRQFIVGSTTTTLLRLSQVPVLVLR